MARDYMLRIRLNSQELERLKAEAERRDVSMSEVIRDYIKRMPKPKKDSAASIETDADDTDFIETETGDAEE
ncbi:MAG: ribbon-helix-helix protein, CopG family [Oscillatoria sp. SIO1A7]|nr:ribbon-helix-helix protein, CopG family [Oscillatoria sp. SIO1A7]